MLYTIVNGQKILASPNSKGYCEICQGAVFSKCGEHRIWHWAHLSSEDCDSWHEPETEWHKNWKLLFPSENVEVVIKKNGVCHRADIMTNEGVCIEVQNSPISCRDRAARESFYGQMCWVINAQVLKNQPVFSFDNEWELHKSEMPLYKSEFQAYGYKKTPALVYDRSNSYYKDLVIKKMNFEQIHNSSSYWLSLRGLNEFEIAEVNRKIIQILNEATNKTFTPSVSEPVTVHWIGFPKVWEESAVPLFFDIGLDRLLYFSTPYERDWNDQALLITKNEFLNNMAIYLDHSSLDFED